MYPELVTYNYLDRLIYICTHSLDEAEYAEILPIKEYQQCPISGRSQILEASKYFESTLLMNGTELTYLNTE